MDKWDMKAQSSIEFMIFIGILLTLFIFMLSLYSQGVYNKTIQQEQLLAEDLLTAIQQEANLAARVNDGYYRKFDIPNRLGMKDYSLVSHDGEVTVIFERQDFETKIPNIVGNFSKGINIIRKESGVVYVNS